MPFDAACVFRVSFFVCVLLCSVSLCSAISSLVLVRLCDSLSSVCDSLSSCLFVIEILVFVIEIRLCVFVEVAVLPMQTPTCLGKPAGARLVPTDVPRSLALENVCCWPAGARLSLA